MSDSHTISYAVALEDMAARVDYFIKESAQLRKQRRTIIGLAVFSAALLLLLAVISEANATAILYLVPAPLVFLFFWLLIHKRTIRRQSLAYFGDGSNPNFFGAKEATVDATGITIRGTVGSAHQSWAAIESINVNDTHVFIELGCTAAHIIPLRKIESGDGVAFLELANRYFTGR